MSEWQLNIASWPGPDRTRWHGLRDIVQESPDGRHVAVVYSCGEVGVNKEIGRFALLAGPPGDPRLLLRPRGLTCLVHLDDTTAQWLGNRYCAVTPYWFGPYGSGKCRTFGGTLYVDVEQRKAAYLAEVYTRAAGPEPPAGLAWRGWRWLSLWPLLWDLKEKWGRWSAGLDQPSGLNASNRERRVGIPREPEN
jgi:hypothetical protein